MEGAHIIMFRDCSSRYKWFNHPSLSPKICWYKKNLLEGLCELFNLNCNCFDKENFFCDLCSDILLSNPPVVALNGSDKVAVKVVLDRHFRSLDFLWPD